MIGSSYTLKMWPDAEDFDKLTSAERYYVTQIMLSAMRDTPAGFIPTSSVPFETALKIARDVILKQG